MDHARERGSPRRSHAGGALLTLLEDGDPERIVEWDRHFFAGTMTSEVLASAAGTLAPIMASVMFGGPDLCTVYLGSLMGATLPCFRAPLPGLALAHWTPTAGRA